MAPGKPIPGCQGSGMRTLRSRGRTPARASKATRPAGTRRGISSFQLAIRRLQPQRDMLRLHRRPDDREQIRVQLCQVRLLAQPGREVFERPPGIVLLAIETPVYSRLDAPPQRVEERGDGEGRCDYSKLVALPEARRQEPLQAHDAAYVNENERSGERTVDQGAV